MGNVGYIKITTTTNKGQKTFLISKSMDDVELENEKLKYQDFSNSSNTTNQTSQNFEDIGFVLYGNHWQNYK